MKRKITVEIDIDTERSGDTVLTGNNPNNFTIAIRNDIIGMFGDKQHVVPCTLVHELGHLIGHVFNLPAATNEPRSLFQMTSQVVNESFGRRVLASENEAWDIGELLLLESKMRKIAIRSYEKEFELIKSTEKYFKNK
jgi:hypothetical protein